MLDHHHGTAGLGGHPAQQRAEGFGLGLGHPAGRLVEQEQGRALGHDAGQLHDPPGASGQLAGGPVAEGGQPELLDNLADPFGGGRFGVGRGGHPERRRKGLAAGQMSLEGNGDGLGHGEVGKQARLLKRTAQAAQGALVGRKAGDVLSVDENPPLIGRQEPADHVEEGGLAGPVVTEQADDLTRPNFEVDVVDGGDPAEPLDQVHALERRLDVSVPRFGRPRAGGLAPPPGHRIAVGGQLRRRLAAGGADEHGAEQIRAIEQLRGRPGEAHLALLQERRPLGQQ